MWLTICCIYFPWIGSSNMHRKFLRRHYFYSVLFHKSKMSPISQLAPVGEGLNKGLLPNNTEQGRTKQLLQNGNIQTILMLNLPSTLPEQTWPVRRAFFWASEAYFCLSLACASFPHSQLVLPALNKDNYSGSASANQTRLYILLVGGQPVTALLWAHRPELWVWRTLLCLKAEVVLHVL